MRMVLLFAVCLAITACHTQDGSSTAVKDRQDVAEGYRSAEISDMAILPPEVAPSPALPEQISEMLREHARRFMIERKLYAVPSDRFVDEKLAGLKEVRTSDLGSDAMLVMEFNQFETAELLTHGRITVGGKIRVMSESDTLFSREFQNKRYLSPVHVTPVNHLEALKQTTEVLVRDILSPIPPKTLQ